MKLRKLLYPFAIIYDGITSIRNVAYQKGIFKSYAFDIPIICVGNLSVGGTGKSPMVNYLVAFLKDDYKIAILSRGYKRKTKGYIEVQPNATAVEVGDEALQIKNNFPDCTVVVCEDRYYAIDKLKDKVELIIMDDGFQHRRVEPQINVLLTAYNHLFFNDFLLPAGNLRESASNYKRAQYIVVTKCPEQFAYASQQEIQYKMKLLKHQELYFSKIVYEPYLKNDFDQKPIDYLTNHNFCLVTGIANPKPLVNFLKDKKLKFTHLSFPDHHLFSKNEINQLAQKKLIITTQKDYMRLKNELDTKNLFYLPISTTLLNNQNEIFKISLKTKLKKIRGV